MKKLFTLIIFLFIALNALEKEAVADAILWSEVTVFLDSITFYTSEGLDVSFKDQTPTGTLACRNEKFQNDIIVQDRTSEGILYHYGVDSSIVTRVRESWALSSTGSGYLQIGFNFYWEFNAKEGYEPDGIYGGPDNYGVIMSVNGGKVLAGDQTNSYYDWHTGRMYTAHQSPAVYFEEGEIAILDLGIMTNANGLWIEKPKAPVPEPSSVILFGTGLIGLASFAKRKNN